ncbi:MAG: helix-turn-helix transcriptional regulator, partial [Candidatus Heimdallarchaeota archaeon]|nr:helix-turn-helix transcriptional regulator [Candidatus Heimdallarchaeota archaeon]
KPNPTEIEQILKQRINFLESTQFLSLNILRYASILSLGLPGLALWIIRNIPLKIIDRNKVQKISLDDFQNVVSRLSFEKALRLIIDNNARIVQEEKDEPGGEFWPIINPLKAISPSFTRSLTRIKKNALPKKEILEEMIFLDYLEGSIQRSELQERSGIKDSSLTYQCQTLLKAGIISYFKEGREVYYRLSSPMKETLELLFFE